MKPRDCYILSENTFDIICFHYFRNFRIGCEDLRYKISVGFTIITKCNLAMNHVNI